METNFMSLVTNIQDPNDLSFLIPLDEELSKHFEHYEIICVHDESNASLSRDDLPSSVKCDAITLINMGKQQGLERSMNAGIDCAVGDFVVEIDDLRSADSTFIWSAYMLAMAGNDIVFGESIKTSIRGRLFYPLFNLFSKSAYKLTTSTCSLVSRRAINRVRTMSQFMPYRKAAYATCGLETTSIPLKAAFPPRASADLGLAIDSLALYSDAFYRISFGFAIFMSLLSAAEIVYILVVFALGHPIGGWTSTMLMMTLGFLGLFVILTFVLKYLTLILNMRFNSKWYLVQNIKKL